MKKKIVMILAIGVVFVLFVTSLVAIFTGDREAPIITFDNNEIIFREGDDTKALLVGVSAYDYVDGDVTSSLTIESIHVLSDGELVSINYVARDRSNNVVKKDRTIPYIQNEVAEEVPSAEAIMVGHEENVEEPETEEVEIEEVETEEVETEEVLVSTGNPIIRLHTNEVRITAGSPFRGMDYVRDAIDDQDYVWTRVRIVGDYSTNIAGQYTLQYYVTDLQGNQSNIENLLLIVE